VSYKNINRNIWNVIISEAALQLINGALMLILLLYLKSKGYSDGENAQFFATRFLGVLFFSLPFGLYIRKRKLAIFFKLATILLPIFTISAVFAVESKTSWLIYLSFLLWGVVFSLAEIAKIPFIMRNAKKENLTQSITLAYITWSFGAVLSGIIIYSLSTLNYGFFYHKNCLIAISLISLIGVYFAYGIKTEVDPMDSPPAIKEEHKKSIYNWDKIIYALLPTFIIAIGAGMSVPFIPLFFSEVFSLDYREFSGYGFIAYLAVFSMMFFAPNIKEKFGLRIGIPLTQTFAVGCLLTLAFMEFNSAWNGALVIAIIAFILRQPLMSIAQPLTTEVIMKYVGQNNHEITASLMALIWNGSFVVSSIAFGIMRNNDVAFATIFICTSSLYVVAIVWYQFLIRRVEKMVD
jgi:MFS family permease